MLSAATVLPHPGVPPPNRLTLPTYTGTRRYKRDGLTVLPVAEFLRALRAGEVF